MTTHRGHYVPQQAKRDVLRDYRRRLQHEFRWSASEALWATRSYYASWLAHHVAAGDDGEIQYWIARYRAADYYANLQARRIHARALRRQRGEAPTTTTADLPGMLAGLRDALGLPADDPRRVAAVGEKNRLLAEIQQAG
jgi:hypothetical protein